MGALAIKARRRTSPPDSNSKQFRYNQVDHGSYQAHGRGFDPRLPILLDLPVQIVASDFTPTVC